MLSNEGRKFLNNYIASLKGEPKTYFEKKILKAEKGYIMF